MNDLFRRKLNNLSKSTKKRLKYYRKFVPDDVANTRPGVRLLGAYTGTDNYDDEGDARGAEKTSTVTSKRRRKKQEQPF